MYNCLVCFYLFSQRSRSQSDKRLAPIKQKILPHNEQVLSILRSELYKSIYREKTRCDQYDLTCLFTHICSKYIWESSVYLHSLLISSPFSGLFLEESKMSEKWCGTFYTSTGAAVVALGSKWNLLLEWNAAAALGVGGQCAAAPNSQSHWLAGYRTPNETFNSMENSREWELINNRATFSLPWKYIDP